MKKCHRKPETTIQNKAANEWAGIWGLHCKCKFSQILKLSCDCSMLHQPFIHWEQKLTVLQSAHLTFSFSRTQKLKASLILPFLRNLKREIHPSLVQIIEPSASILSSLNNNVWFSAILMQRTFCTTQAGAFGQDCSSS